MTIRPATGKLRLFRLGAALLLLLGCGPIFAQTPAITAASTAGHVSQRSGSGKWSGVYADRPILTGGTIVTAADGSVELKLGPVSIQLGALTIARIQPPSGSTDAPDFVIELPAGELQIKAPASGSAKITVTMPFATLNTENGALTIDGNRVHVTGGSAAIANSDGYRRTLVKGESVVVPRRGPFPPVERD